MLKDILCDVGVRIATGPTEVIKRNIEPLVNALVDCMVFIADSSRRSSFLQCLHLSSSPILISPANEQHVVSHHPAEASIHISRKDSAYYIAKMGSVVYIRQRRCD